MTNERGGVLTEKDFYVIYPHETATKTGETPPSYETLLAAAGQTYDPANREYSVYLTSNDTQASLTQSRIEELSVAPQSDLSKTQEIMEIDRQYVNKNDLFGATQDAIENNVNTDIRLIWADERVLEDKRDEKTLARAKAVITDFNEKINLDRVIREAITSTFRDGTHVLYLRRRSESAGKGVENLAGADYVVDSYPLGVVEISDYEVGGDPYVLMNMDELKNRLSKTHKTTKKKQPLFFRKTDDEVKANYAPEVQKAYAAKEKYAKLDLSNSGVMRINNQGRQYGLSPYFRALTPALLLEKFEAADRAAARNRSKTIIHQQMIKEILGPEYKKDAYEDQARAHKNFMDAWGQSIVAVTTPPSVSKISYIEPKGETTNIQMIEYLRGRIMSTLGVEFMLSGDGQSLGSVNLGTKQLMRTINKISRQVEPILEKWYRMVLQNCGLDPSYAPRVEIIDSEYMEPSVKMELARTLHQTFNCSYETAFEVMGRSYRDERERREKENKDGTGDTFEPWGNAYTASPDKKGGRGGTEGPTAKSAPKPGEKKGGRTPDKDSKNLEKQAYDHERYQALNQ